jgi:hypothetical protein
LIAGISHATFQRVVKTLLHPQIQNPSPKFQFLFKLPNSFLENQQLTILISISSLTTVRFINIKILIIPVSISITPEICKNYQFELDLGFFEGFSLAAIHNKKY